MPELKKVIPLERRKVLKKAFAPTMLRLVVAIPAFLLFFWLIDTIAQGQSATALAMRERETGLLFAVLLLLICWAFSTLAYEILYFNKYYYDIDDRNLIIRKGVVVTKEAILPFSKITDVYVDQDPLDVVFGVYDVHISTPTAVSGEFAHIDGVSRKNATILRDMILDKIHKETDISEDNEKTAKADS